MNKAYQYYVYYIALRLHFNDANYNFFKYNGKVKQVNEHKFNGRNDKYFFEKATRTYDTETYLNRCLTEMKVNTKFFIKDIFTKNNEDRYFKRKGYLESFIQSYDYELSSVISYCIKNKISQEQLLKGNRDDERPVIYNLLIKNVISIETFIGINKVYDINSELLYHSLNPMVNNTMKFINNYYPFITRYLPPAEKLLTTTKKHIDLLNQTVYTVNDGGY